MNLFLLLRGLRKGSKSRNRRIVWIVLVVSLAFSAAATLYMKSNVDRIAKRDFIVRCEEIHKVIAKRLEDHARILTSGAALFNASDAVTRQEWRFFTQTHKIEKQLPGIQGIGFSLLIPREGLPQHIQEVKSEGFPEYRVKPEGDRDIYSSIIYLEPFSDRNLRALGYDMFQEPVRRKAMEQARDTDSAALSGKVVLVQETDEEVQAGTLMYVPVYRKGMPTYSVEERRAAIYGWVYSPYRMNDLMQGVLGDINFHKEKQLRLQVFDGAETLPQNLLYENYPVGEQKRRHESLFTKQLPVDLNGHRWTLSFTQTSGGFMTAEYISVWLAMVGGTLITLLLLALTISLLSVGTEAQRMAEKLTVNLRESEEKFRLLVENSHDIIYRLTPDGVFTFVSPAWTVLLGHTVNQVEGHPFQPFIHPDDLAGCMAWLKKVIETGRRQEGIEYRVRHSDGSWRWHTSSAVPLRNKADAIIGFEGTARDITERKKAEEALVETEEKIHLLLNSTAEAIYGLDMNGKCTFCNKSCLDLLGYKHPDELLGKNMHWQIHAKHPDGTPFPVEECRIFKAFKKGEGTHVDDEVLWRSDGTSFPAEYWSYPQRRDGLVVGAVVTFVNIAERKRTENALRESEETLRVNIENSFDVIFTLNKEGVFSFISSSWERHFGYPPSDVVGKAFAPFVHPDDIASLVEYLKRVLSTGKSETSPIYRVKHADGSWRLFVCNGTPYVDKKGDPQFSGVGRDITDAKNAEDALKQISDRLLLASRAGGVGVWDYDVVNNKLVWDDQMYRLYGITADKFSGAYDAWQTGLHPEDKKRGDDEIQMALRGEKEFDIEFRVLWPDGTSHYIRALAMVQRDVSGKPLRMIGTNWDITERKRAENALRESEEVYRALFTESRDAMMTIIPGGRFLSGNPEVIRMFGFRDEKDFISRTPAELSPKYQPDGALSSDKAREMMMLAVEKGSNFFEWTHKRINGPEFSATVLLSRVEKGDKTYLQATVRDITEQKKMEEALINANAELEDKVMERTKELRDAQDKIIRSEKLAAIGKLAASVAHELRNPLGVMKNAAYYLNMLGLTKNSPKLKKNLDIISQEIENSDKIIEDLLEFSRTKKPVFQSESINLIIKEIIDRLRIAPNIELALEFGDNLPNIEVDASQMHQVFYNIAKNALESMEKGGKLKIKTCVRDDFMEISFSDTGGGISKENIQKIFEPLFSTKKRGTGLGLSVCAMLVERHSGKIDVQSEADKGTTFIVKLPFREGITKEINNA